MLAGNARVFAPLAAGTELAVTGGTGSVDFLCLFDIDVGRPGRTGKECRNQQQATDFLHESNPRNSARIISAASGKND